MRIVSDTSLDIESCLYTYISNTCPSHCLVSRQSMQFLSVKSLEERSQDDSWVLSEPALCLSKCFPLPAPVQGLSSPIILILYLDFSFLIRNTGWNLLWFIGYFAYFFLDIGICHNQHDILTSKTLFLCGEDESSLSNLFWGNWGNMHFSLINDDNYRCCF